MVLSQHVHKVAAILLVCSVFIEFWLVRYSLFVFIQWLAVESMIEYHTITSLYPSRLSLLYHIGCTFLLGYAATFHHLFDFISLFVVFSLIHLILWILILSKLELPQRKLKQAAMIDGNGNNINQQTIINNQKNIFSNLFFGTNFEDNINYRERNVMNNDLYIAGENRTKSMVDDNTSIYFDLLIVPNNVVHRMMGFSTFLQLYFEFIQCKVLYYDYFWKMNNEKNGKSSNYARKNNGMKNEFDYYNLNESIFLDDDTNIYDNSGTSQNENGKGQKNNNDSDSDSAVIDNKQLSLFIGDYLANHRKYDQLTKRHFSEMTINYFGFILIPFLYFHICLLFNSQHSVIPVIYVCMIILLSNSQTIISLFLSFVKKQQKWISEMMDPRYQRMKRMKRRQKEQFDNGNRKERQESMAEKKETITLGGTLSSLFMACLVSSILFSMLHFTVYYPMCSLYKSNDKPMIHSRGIALICESNFVNLTLMEHLILSIIISISSIFGKILVYWIDLCFYSFYSNIYFVGFSNKNLISGVSVQDTVDAFNSNPKWNTIEDSFDSISFLKNKFSNLMTGQLFSVLEYISPFLLSIPISFYFILWR